MKPIYGHYENSLYNEYTFIEPENKTSIVQTDFIANLTNDQIFESFSSGGTLSIANGIASMAINSSVGSYYTLRCRKIIKHRGGNAIIFKGSAKFDSNAVSNSLQMIGLGTSSNDIYMGMSGSSFVSRVSNQGKHHKILLTITANPSGAETISLTLNSVLFTGTVAVSGALSFSAHQVSKMNAFTNWNFQHINNTIIFSGASVGDRSGTYSISSSGTLTGTITTISTGTDLNTTTTTLSNMNGDPAMIRRFNPYLWNSYQIVFEYSNNNIGFYVYNEISGKYQLIHSNRYSSITGGSVSVSQPDFYIQRVVASVGSSTALTSLFSSCSAAIAGNNIPVFLPRYSVNASETIAGGTEEVILSTQHRLVLNDTIAINEIILDSFSISVDGTKSVLIKFIKNPTTLGNNSSTNYDNYQYVDSTYSQSVYDTTAQTYTGGLLVFQIYLDKVSTNTFDLSKLGIIISRNDTLILTATSTNTSDILCSLSYVEDI